MGRIIHYRHLYHIHKLLLVGPYMVCVSFNFHRNNFVWNLVKPTVYSQRSFHEEWWVFALYYNWRTPTKRRAMTSNDSPWSLPRGIEPKGCMTESVRSVNGTHLYQKQKAKSMREIEKMIYTSRDLLTKWKCQQLKSNTSNSFHERGREKLPLNV